jgi:bifunctional non-homologous end joining protein LigD
MSSISSIMPRTIVEPPVRAGVTPTPRAGIAKDVTKTARALTEYRRKRRFEETPEPEPSGDGDAAKPQDASGRFVVHEHHARRLHWDLRLERGGVLVSWAIPNGIPEDPRHNRKAVHVEDHPLDYIDFAGTIPEGSYGAGEVKVWDSGTYAVEKWERGKVVVAFDGEQLQGRYALFHAGRSEKDWMIHRMDPPADPKAVEMPKVVEPMLARLSTMPSDETDWAFEVKWDGVRAVARSEPGRIHLHARNGNDVTAAYPELRALNRALGSHSAMLDGEIVAFDEDGKPSFQALQPRIHLRGERDVRRAAAATPVTYAIFDLLWLDGHSLLELPYSERRERLAELELDGEHWRVPKHHTGKRAGSALLDATREQGLEGIVAKRLDSAYTPGRRGGSWLKVKHSRRQELVVGGWTDGRGNRARRIGALELGVHDDDGALRYAGRVGTGFDEAELRRLGKLLRPLAREDSPFTGPQPARGAHFVEPELVCEVEFSEWTRDGRLRHPVYEGLRDDKPALEVVRERVAPPTTAGAAEPSSPSDEPLAPLDVSALAASGRRVRGGVEVEVEGRPLKLTNLDKVLYPQTGFTKGDLVAWYAAIAPVLLPHLRDHPLTLKRYPDGVDGKFFYEKQSPRHRPEWVETVTVYSRHSRRDIHYTLCQDLPTLMWLGNLADVELHPSLSRADEIERPTTLAFDLDPGPPATIVECCEVALELREMFDQLGLRACAKTSGSKGLQVYVPLNDPDVTYEQTKPFAHAVANLFEQRRPELIVSEMRKKGGERDGKVLIDWSQNDEHKTTVSVYSPRAKERPTVSTPLTWDEVARCRKKGDPDLLVFETAAVLARVAEHGDLFAEVASLTQSLPALRGLGG